MHHNLEGRVHFWRHKRKHQDRDARIDDSSSNASNMSPNDSFSDAYSAKNTKNKVADDEQFESYNALNAIKALKSTYGKKKVENKRVYESIRTTDDELTNLSYSAHVFAALDSSSDENDEDNNNKPLETPNEIDDEDSKTREDEEKESTSKDDSSEDENMDADSDKGDEQGQEDDENSNDENNMDDEMRKSSKILAGSDLNSALFNEDKELENVKDEQENESRSSKKRDSFLTSSLKGNRESNSLLNSKGSDRSRGKRDSNLWSNPDLSNKSIGKETGEIPQSKSPLIRDSVSIIDSKKDILHKGLSALLSDSKNTTGREIPSAFLDSFNKSNEKNAADELGRRNKSLRDSLQKSNSLNSSKSSSKKSTSDRQFNERFSLQSERTTRISNLYRRKNLVSAGEERNMEKKMKLLSKLYLPSSVDISIEENSSSGSPFGERQRRLTEAKIEEEKSSDKDSCYDKLDHRIIDLILFFTSEAEKRIIKTTEEPRFVCLCDCHPPNLMSDNK